MNATFAENVYSFFPDSHFRVLVITSASINTFLGLPLNCYVMCVMLAGARETLASDLFYLNLAVSEIFLSLSFIWYFFYAYLRSLVCFVAFMFSCGLLSTARPLFQCCICVECYVGVVHPLLFLQLKPLRYRVACSCVVWLIVLVSCIYSVFTYSNTLYLYGFFIQYLLFFFIMLFCCLSVLWALKCPGPGVKTTENIRNTMKQRAFKIILLTMISMALNFFLFIVAIPLQHCLTLEVFLQALSICSNLALTTGFLQPFLYLRRTGKIACFREL